jgi:hypothetical protein
MEKGSQLAQGRSVNVSAESKTLRNEDIKGRPVEKASALSFQGTEYYRGEVDH